MGYNKESSSVSGCVNSGLSSLLLLRLAGMDMQEGPVGRSEGLPERPTHRPFLCLLPPHPTPHLACDKAPFWAPAIWGSPCCQRCWLPLGSSSFWPEAGNCRTQAFSVFFPAVPEAASGLCRGLSGLGPPLGRLHCHSPIRGRQSVSEQTILTEGGAPVDVCERITQT